MMFNNWMSPYDYFGDDYYVSPRQYEMLRRQEELKRRRAAQAERQRQEAMMRQRLAYEQELSRRLKEEEEYKRQLREEEEELQRRQAWDRRRRNKQQRMGYQIVRGLDGRLYRVPVVLEDGNDDAEYDKREPSYLSSRKPTVEPRFSRRSSSSLESLPENDDASDSSSDHDVTVSIKPTRTNEKQSSDGVSINIKPAERKASKSADGKKKPRRRKVTVIVEDASDSEYEDDEFRSVWRNRRPSPGQWMEPVDLTN